MRLICLLVAWNCPLSALSLKPSPGKRTDVHPGHWMVVEEGERGGGEIERERERKKMQVCLVDI